jgi:hypothetical protein
MDYWSGVLDWTTGGVWSRMRKTVFILAESLVGLRRAVVHLLESAMDRDSALPLGTENDPIIILDSSPGYAKQSNQPQSIVTDF